MLRLMVFALTLVLLAGAHVGACGCEEWKNTDNYNLRLGETYMDPDGRLAITVLAVTEDVEVDPFAAMLLTEGHRPIAVEVVLRNATDYVISVTRTSNFWLEDDAGNKYDPSTAVAVPRLFDGQQIRPGTQRRGLIVFEIPEGMAVSDLVFVYNMSAIPEDFDNPSIRNSEYAVYHLGAQ